MKLKIKLSMFYFDFTQFTVTLTLLTGF